MNLIGIFGATGAIFGIIAHSINQKELYIFLPVVLILISFLSLLYSHSRSYYGLAKFSLFIVYPLIQFMNLMFVETENYGVILIIFPFALVANLIFAKIHQRILVTLYILILSFYPIRHHLFSLGSYFITNPVSYTHLTLPTIYSV